jgi:hypothetical protein
LTFPYGLGFKKENLFRMQVAGIKIEVKLKNCVIKITQPQMLMSIIQLSRLEKKLAGQKAIQKRDVKRASKVKAQTVRDLYNSYV